MADDDVVVEAGEEELLPSTVYEDEEEENPSSFRTCIEEETTTEKVVTLVTEEDEKNDVGDDDDDTTCTEDASSDGGSSYDEEGEDSMHVLFKYNRLFGSLPRRTAAEEDEAGQQQQQERQAAPPLSFECTASALGRLVLNAENTTTQQQQQENYNSAAAHDHGSSSSVSQGAGALSVARGSTTTITTTTTTGGGRNTAISLPSPLPVPILALGFSDGGGVWIVDAMTAQAVGTPGQLQSSTSSTSTIVAVSWDASATQLAAIDGNGSCTIWNDLKYAVVLKPPSSFRRRQRQQRTTTNGGTGATTVNTNAANQPSRRTTQRQEQEDTQQQQPQHNAFRGFMNILTGQSNPPPPPPPSSPSSSAAGQPQQPQTPASAADEDGDEDGGDDSVASTEQPGDATAASPIAEEGQEDNGDEDGNDDEDDEASHGLVPTLTLASSSTSSSVPLQQQRVTYPSSFGRPTCMAIDPAYRRRREKSLIVGFENGRLVLTKRGMIFQRRTDSVLYHAEEGPIQAMTWRGSLLAWADLSGIRLMDVDQMVRIAHVDRPTGARPSLYPSRVVWPSLCFETSQQLLVAWGDCLLSLYVHEQQQRSKSSSSAASQSDGEAGTSSPGSQPPPPPPPSSIARRTVECNLAWQLDCVACGVAPLDAEHVVVLGQSLLEEDDDDEEGSEEGDYFNNNKGCDMELQVVSRTNGQVLSADTLPLAFISQQQEQQEPSSRWQRGRGRAGSQSDASPLRSVATLMSSFAVPRMDNVTETQLQQQEGEWFDTGGGTAGGGMDPLQTMTTSLFASDGQRRSFCDSHLKWDLKLVIQMDKDKVTEGQNHSQADTSAKRMGDDDTKSIDSDDYDLLHHPVLQDGDNNEASSVDGHFVFPPPPPVMVVASSHDVVLARMRDTDDTISSALANNKAALALKRGLNHLRQLRRYDIHDLVNEYFRALLKLPSDGETLEEEGKGPLSYDGVDQDKVKSKKSNRRHLSLRRMKLAAEAMPILLGGDASMWNMWIGELEKIPGALFIARPVLPVRDPILPKRTYSRVLEKMLTEIEHMTPPSSDVPSSLEKIILEAEGHFLNSLLGWGPIALLSEFIRLYEQQVSRDPRFSTAVHSLEESLVRRKEQTSACYLKFRSSSATSSKQQLNTVAPRTQMLSSAGRMDALFDVDEVLSTIAQRISVVAPGSLTTTSATTSPEQVNSRVALDAGAKLSMMKGSFDDALRFFLMIGAHHPTKPWGEMEDEAISVVNRGENSGKPLLKKPQRDAAYAYVIPIIENHHLHQYLLNSEFLFRDKTVPPLFALLQLVGLELFGDFLIEHCVAPQIKRPDEALTRSGKMQGERRGTLPIDLVARQLDGSPKLLHWYLHSVFVHKPSVYVVFPLTSLPPPIITSIHRMHIDFYIRFAGENRDSAEALEGIDAYRVSDKTTPLLAFLKVVLRLGGISSMEVARILEKERKGGSRTFALELAYIMEHFGDDSEDEARLILDLYLKGAQNLMLAVSYAQRTQEHSSKLWDILISHCLSSETRGEHQLIDGSLFGSLLEAAALSGADLALLVKQIPPGMSIHGLRPRLVAAVADYRLKLQMRHSSSDIANAEKIALLREVAHRSRRGIRFEKLNEPRQLPILGTTTTEQPGGSSEETAGTPLNVLRLSQRTIKRRDRCKLAYSLPLR